jgi:Helix-turn-helix domain
MKVCVNYSQNMVDMSCDRQERSSDSRFVQSVTRVVYHRRSVDLSVPDGRWDIVIFRSRGKPTVLLTGATTRPITSVNKPGDELLCISFKPGVYMPAHAPAPLRDRAIVIGNPTSRSLSLGSQIFEIPDYENADDFVASLSKRDLLAYDELVDSVLTGEPRAASIRSLQRHFLQATGLTFNFHKQIERARLAMDLLRQGQDAVDVALEVGYTDQSHMINSLKSIMGQTPTQILRSRR